MRANRLPLTFALFAAWAWASVSPADAQVVIGRVVDASTGQPIPSASVRLLDTAGSQLASVVTGEDGDFIVIPRLRLRAARSVNVAVTMIGYDAAETDTFTLAPRDTVALAPIQLVPAAIAMDTLRVERRRSLFSLTPPREKIRRRQLEGKGTFLHGSALANRPERYIAQTLAQLEGLQVRTDHPYPVLETTEGRRCLVLLVNEWSPARAGFRSIEEIPRDAIAAVEVYNSYAEVPSDLQLYAWQGMTPCGIVSIWTWNAWDYGG